MNVVYFLLGNSLACEFYMLTFRNTLSHLHSQVNEDAIEDGTDIGFILISLISGLFLM